MNVDDTVGQVELGSMEVGGHGFFERRQRDGFAIDEAAGCRRAGIGTGGNLERSGMGKSRRDTTPPHPPTFTSPIYSRSIRMS